MADENPMSAEQAKKIKSALEETAQSADQLTKKVGKLTQQTQKYYNMIEKHPRRITAGLQQSARQYDQTMHRFAKSTKTGMRQVEQAIFHAMGTSNKHTLGALLALQKWGKEAQFASKRAVDLQNSMEDTSAQFRRTAVEIANNTMKFKALESELGTVESRMQALQATQKAGNTLTEESAAELEKLQKRYAEINDEIDDFKKLKQEHEGYRAELVKGANQLTVYKKRILESRDAMLAEVEAQRQLNYELQIYEGGVKAVGATVRKNLDKRVFDFIRGVGSTALIIMGLKKLDNALAQTSDFMRANAQVSAMMGETAEIGIGGFAKSFSEASKTVSTLGKLSGDLGYTMEELGEAANRVRMGLKMDREGRITEAALRNVTTEAAKFSKVAGIDLSASLDLVEFRVKSMGMTVEEAAKDLQVMRVQLHQMMAGAKNTGIAMDEMVGIINDASIASQSYVVDTRLMTQALRGAVNQANLLGASQKEAKDTAQALGKVVSGAPDWVKIPAGHDLFSQLMGAKSDEFLMKFDKATRKRLMSLKDSIASGKVGKESASRALMSIVGLTDAGMEAQFEQVKKVLFTNGKRNEEAALVIAQQYGIDNAAVAQSLTTMMQDAAELQAKFGREAIPFSVAMAKQTAEFDNAISEASAAGKDIIQVLKDKGLSEKDAKEYFDLYSKGAEKQKVLEAQIAQKRAQGLSTAKEEMELFQEVTGARAQALANYTRPVERTLADLKKAGILKDREMQLNADELKKVGVTNAEELAERFGIASKDNVKKLRAIYEQNQTISADQLEDMKRAESAAIEEQERRMNDTLSKFSDGLIGGMKRIAASVLGALGLLGPLGSSIAGLALVAGGLYTLMRGGRWLTGFMGKALTPTIEAGTYAALVRSGNVGAGKLGPGGPPGGPGGVAGGAAKGAGRLAKWGGRALGALGVGLTAYNLYSDVKGINASDMSEAEKSKAKTTAYAGTGGTLAGGLAGAKLGAMGGAALGSVFPGLGTAVGAGVGGLAGGAIGAWGGGAGAEWLANALQSESERPRPPVPPPSPSMQSIVGPTPSSLPLSPEDAYARALSDQHRAMGGFAGVSAGAPSLAAGRGPGTLIGKPSLGGFGPDGALTLKIENFMGVMSDAKRESTALGFDGF